MLRGIKHLQGKAKATFRLFQSLLLVMGRKATLKGREKNFIHLFDTAGPTCIRPDAERDTGHVVGLRGGSCPPAAPRPM